MKLPTLIAAVAISAVPLPVAAETIRLTLAQTLERAQKFSPSVQLAEKQVAEAEASRVGQYVFLTNPRLSGDYRTLFPGTQGEPPYGFGANLETQFEVSGANHARVSEAHRRIDVAKAELSIERQLSAARAWEAYIDLALATQRISLLDESLKIVRDIEGASNQRLQAGAGGEGDVAAAKVEVAAVQVQRADAQWLQRRAELELQTALDLQPGTRVTLDTPLPELGAPQEMKNLVKRALEKRPELATTRARIALLEQTDSRLVREAIPRLGVYLGLDSAPASPMFGLAGLSVELPVAQRNQGPRAVAKAQRQTELTRLETDLRIIERQVLAATAEYETRRNQLELLSNDAVPAAERNLALTEQGWRSGRFDIYRYTAASRELVRVRRERVEALAAAWGRFITLERLSGGLTP